MLHNTLHMKKTQAFAHILKKINKYIYKNKYTHTEGASTAKITAKASVGV